MARPGRDWFGVVGFDPGPERQRGFLYLLDEVGSTSDFLLGRGEPALGRLCRWDGWGWQCGDRQHLKPPVQVRPGSMVAARRQTAGRGRQGRSWFSSGFNLSWTIDPVPRRQAARLAVWTGLMAVEAVRETTGEPIMLKWPNDLFLNGRKCGGMILDLVLKGHERRLVAGLGMNIGAWPQGMPMELRLNSAILPTAVESTLASLAQAILGRCDREVGVFWKQGWGPFRAAFRARDILRDQRVVLSTPQGTVAGIARGIDESGALLLEGEDGAVRNVLAGDVHMARTGIDDEKETP